MPTNILGVSIPDSPLGVNEMCHEFTFNYLFQTIFLNQGLITPYYQGTTYRHLLFLLIRVGKKYLLPGSPIQPGDILIFSTTPNIQNNPPVTHSMVALGIDHWIGANNTGTFNGILQQLNMGLLPMGRSGIMNIGGLQLNNQSVYNATTGILNIVAPNNVMNRIIPLYVHIYR